MTSNVLRVCSWRMTQPVRRGEGIKEGGREGVSPWKLHDITGGGRKASHYSVHGIKKISIPIERKNSRDLDMNTKRHEDYHVKIFAT